MTPDRSSGLPAKGPDRAAGPHAAGAGPADSDPALIVAFDDIEDPELWVKPGPRSDIDIVDHDADWAAQYEVLARRVHSALGDEVLHLQHIGSTSVPDLAAKPVIDIDLVVSNPRDESAYRPRLESIGYDLVIREPGWYEHRAFAHADPDTGVPRSPLSNLHVFGPHCPEVARHRLFRDWLREHPDDRRLYENAKRAAAVRANEAGETVMQYNARKEEVLRAIYRRIFASEGWI